MEAEFAGKPIRAQHHRLQAQSDLDNMLDTPTRGAHRRTQSETFFRFPDFDDDDILLDNLHFSPPPPQPPPQPTRPEDDSSGHVSHFRSLSVDADFFGGLDIEGASWADVAGEGFNSSTTSSFEAVDCSKKAMAPEKLAQLALSDPRKAKRILANRQSAARSKERKVRYTGELERKVQTLQAEATTLSTQVTKLQRDTSGAATENKELRLRLEALEQQAHLRDALNEALKEELKHLKIVAGEIQVVNGLHYTQPQAFNGFRGSHPQYAQQQKQQQQPFHELPRPTDVNPNFSRQPQPNYRGFNHRV